LHKSKTHEAKKITDILNSVKVDGLNNQGVYVSAQGLPNAKRSLNNTSQIISSSNKQLNQSASFNMVKPTSQKRLRSSKQIGNQQAAAKK